MQGPAVIAIAATPAHIGQNNKIRAPGTHPAGGGRNVDRLGVFDQFFYKADQYNVISMIMGGASIMAPARPRDTLDANAIADHLAARLSEIPLLRVKFGAGYMDVRYRFYGVGDQNELGISIDILQEAPVYFN